MATAGICRECGCTEMNACPILNAKTGAVEGCSWWPGTGRTVCKACKLKMRDNRTPVEKIVAAFGPPELIAPVVDLLAAKLDQPSDFSDMQGLKQGSLFE